MKQLWKMFISSRYIQALLWLVGITGLASAYILLFGVRHVEFIAAALLIAWTPLIGIAAGELAMQAVALLDKLRSTHMHSSDMHTNETSI